MSMLRFGTTIRQLHGGDGTESLIFSMQSGKYNSGKAMFGSILFFCFRFEGRFQKYIMSEEENTGVRYIPPLLREALLNLSGKSSAVLWSSCTLNSKRTWRHFSGDSEGRQRFGIMRMNRKRVLSVSCRRFQLAPEGKTNSHFQRRKCPLP